VEPTRQLAPTPALTCTNFDHRVWRENSRHPAPPSGRRAGGISQPGGGCPL